MAVERGRLAFASPSDPLTGRLTRNPQMRSLASGKNVTTFTVASNEFIGGGREKAEYQRKGKV